MKITITDVAKDCGVSIATVSNVINNNQNVSSATAARVMDSVRKLGYVSNKVSKYQRYESKKLIAYIVPALNNAYYSHLATIIEEFLQAQEYDLITVDTHNSVSEECSKIEKLTGIVDGFIIVSSASDSNELKEVLPRHIPAVFIDRKPKNCDYDTLVINNYRSLYQSVIHLTASGHKKIGLLSGELHLSPMAERYHAYKDAMSATSEGFQPDLVRFVTDEQNSFMKCMDELLEQGCTAIVASNNSLTVKSFAQYPWFKEKSLSVEITGFSDEELTAFAKQNLNLIYQPTDELAKLAVEQIIRRMNTPELPAREFILTSFFRSRTDFTDSAFGESEMQSARNS